jgi:hypothetical protein
LKLSTGFDTEFCLGPEDGPGQRTQAPDPPFRSRLSTHHIDRYSTTQGREDQDQLHRPESLIWQHPGGVAVAAPVKYEKVFAYLQRSVGGDFQERCHSWAALQAAFVNGTAGVGIGSSGGLLIHTTSGWRRQRVDRLHRRGYFCRAFSQTWARCRQISTAWPLWRCWGVTHLMPL